MDYPFRLFHFVVTCGLFVPLAACQPVHVDVSAGHYPPFIKAAQQGDIAEAERLLKSGEFVTQTTIGDQTALHLAAAEGHNKMVTWLVAHEASLLAKTQNGETPAEFAREQGKKSTEKLLLDYVDLRRQEEEATARGDIEKLRKLLATDARRYTVLHVLAGRGDVEAVRKEIRAGGDVNAKTVNGLTPLHKVTISGNPKLARALLDAGADVNGRDIYGATPLFYAISLKNKDLVKLYLEAGADPNNRVVWDQESALETARKIGNPEILAMVEEHARQR